MSKVWFTSDTHFGSERTLEFSKRPFKSVEEMDSEIIKRWNEVVSEDDTVYHLGDFGNYDIVKQLNGKVRLLCGNYENKDNWENYRNNESFEHYLLGKGFSAVNICHSFCVEDISCCHEPSKCNAYMFNLFGHIHKLQMVKKTGLNVGTDCHNFYPIDMDTVNFYRNAIENHYDFDVFC